MVTQLNAFGQIYSLRTCTPALATETFLTAMRKATDATFPAWRELIKTALEELRLSYDTRRAVLDLHPLDDYYFAAAVGKEAAQIRTLFAAEEATELLAEIGERVDAAAGRSDRLVSSLVFDIVSHLELVQAQIHRLPHDEVVAVLLKRMNIDTTLETRDLMGDMLFRHHLSEPIALGIPAWWAAFRAKFTIAKVATASLAPVRVPVPAPVIRRRAAQSLI